MRRWKRTLLAAMCMLGMAARAQAMICITAEETAALLSADGRELVAPGQYGSILSVIPGERCALGAQTAEGMRYALGDAQGQPLTQLRYTMFQAAGEGRILFREGGLYGAMDADGNVLLPAAYTQLVCAPDGTYLAMRTDPFDGDADGIYRVTEHGEETLTGVRTDEGLEPLSSDRMPYQDPATEKYGYIDGTGSIAIGARFDSAGGFENGWARASENGKLGLIGPDGLWRIAPEFDYLETGDRVTVGLAGRESFVVFDETGAERFRVTGTGLEAALAGDCPVLLTEEEQIIYSPEGEVIYRAPRAATVTPGADGMLILADGDWGASCVSLVSPDGTRAVRTDQHLVPLDSDRYAFIRMNAASYYSEALDEIRISCDYDSLRYGMMNAAGEEILPPEFLEIRALGQGRYLTVAEDGLRMTDRDGNVLWEHLKE